LGEKIICRVAENRAVKATAEAVREKEALLSKRNVQLWLEE
jgi:hypothetical protein